MTFTSRPGRRRSASTAVTMSAPRISDVGAQVRSASVSVSETTCFSVALIPANLADTTLGDLVDGDRVNLEVDLVASVARR